ncbi:Glycine/D-amino acid oxidase [Arsukibacterium tuosuense]|uniref:Glycine/D-amino acid oxidase n=1 Tax=Arsukibacterium tuosuense TaxID=1323745 RepID=A0A285I2Z3_9GAMM|nr:FAD-binding oxidoreductase [Arsukibacterium tuosuense]SNY41446.1 Glycine/D-amino acid oxidase [Arsukibacterium tuosuense]
MYDPYVDSQLNSNQADVASYWQAETPEQVNYPAIVQDISCDTVVVGAGYTGLNCGYELAANHQRDVVVIEALQPGWGCSGRNGGFVLRGTGRLGLAQLADKFGLDTARLFHQEYGEAIARVNQLIEVGNINCQPQPVGYYKLAHKPGIAKDLARQAEFLQQHFAYPVRYLDKSELQQTVVNHQQAYAALSFPDCYGLNPLALAQGYSRMAVEAGAKLYGRSPVLSFKRCQTGFEVVTPQAVIRSSNLVLATNAYTARGLYPALNNSCLPVLSSIIVTEPLNSQQLQQVNWQQHSIMMDTRTLKYYYRLLPDNRILFGGRGAITGKAAADPLYARRLLAALKLSFAGLEQLNYQYQWSGWVGVSFDDLPRIYSPEPNLFYAAGYCGSGLSFSAHAGKRLAQLVTGKVLPALPIYQSGLKEFPMTAFRRQGQQLYYQWGRFKDHFL